MVQARTAFGDDGYVEMALRFAVLSRIWKGMVFRAFSSLYAMKGGSKSI
jgi:hypothetical protein